MFSCWQLYDGNWIGGNFVFLKEVLFRTFRESFEHSVAGASTGGGRQGAEVGLYTVDIFPHGVSN